VPPIRGDDWASSTSYLRGVRLFNAGYYWEAHEAWEGLWLAQRRVGPTADVLKALIKLAAAGVKVRQGQPRGVSTHARRAAELFQAVRQAGHDRLLGLDLAGWEAIARAVADDPPVGPPASVGVVAGALGPTIEPVDR
jgi:predicted metal-dependent hydrolase